MKKVKLKRKLEVPSKKNSKTIKSSAPPKASRFLMMQEYCAVQRKIDNYGSSQNTFRGFAISIVAASILASGSGMSVVPVLCAIVLLCVIRSWELKNDQSEEALKDRASTLEIAIRVGKSIPSPKIAVTIGKSTVKSFFSCNQFWYVALVVLLILYVVVFCQNELFSYKNSLIKDNPTIKYDMIVDAEFLRGNNCFSRVVKKKFSDGELQYLDEFWNVDVFGSRKSVALKLNSVLESDVFERECSSLIKQHRLSSALDFAVLRRKLKLFNYELLRMYYPESLLGD